MGNLKRSKQIFTSDAYIGKDKPKNITKEDWAIWLRYNEGLNIDECSLEFKIPSTRVVKIFSNITKVLKDLKKDEVSHSMEFENFFQAMEFRNRIRENYLKAEKKARRIKSNEIIIQPVYE